MKRLAHHLFALGLALVTTVSLAADLTLYSGRSKGLVDPIVQRFQAETGISVNVRYGDTAEIAIALLEEGDKSPADLVWAQDAGALGTLDQANRLASLADIQDRYQAMIPLEFQGPSNRWIATSGRARTLAYSSSRLTADKLPETVFELTDPQWQGRVGWAPTNGSFQAFVTGMRAQVGDAETAAWLTGMKNNGAKAYRNNSALLDAIANNEIDLALPNHYYLLRYKITDPNFPVEQTRFRANDPGNLVNIAGIGITNTSKNPELAMKFVQFLLDAWQQAYFTNRIMEYPVLIDFPANPNLMSLKELLTTTPDVQLDQLTDLSGTLELLHKTSVLP